MTIWVGAGSADPKSLNIFAKTGVTLRSSSAVTPMATMMTMIG